MRRYEALEAQRAEDARDESDADGDDGDASPPNVAALVAQLEAEMASASGGLVAVTFVSHVQEEGKVIELYDESTHICNLELGKAFTTNTAPRRKWSMRCEGSTLRVFTVPSVGACFELEAEYKLPKRRGPRRAAARRERTDRFDPEENAAREQWAPGRA